MTDTQVDKVVDAFWARKEIERFSHIADYPEIQQNDYNLNIPRYVDSFVPEPLPDIGEILRNLKQIDQEEQQLRKEIYDMLGELIGSPEDMAFVEKHREILKPKQARKQKPINTQYKQMELTELWN